MSSCGRWMRSELTTLPNGLTLEAPNRAEAAFLYEEIFNSDAYLRHGIGVSDGATVFDVGANIGLFSVALAQRHGNLKLHLFEPVPSTFAILERNAQRLLAGAEVELHRVALAARPGRATLELNPRWSLDAGMDTQSFARNARRRVGLTAWTRAFVHDAARAGGMSPRVCRGLEQGLRKPLVSRLLLGGVWLLERVVTQVQRRTVQRVECPLTTVSEAMRGSRIEAVDLLKIDVEGAEWEVLQGVDDTDWPRLRQLVIEVHNIDGRVERVRNLLESHGFVVASEQDDWELLRLMDVHMVYARRVSSAASSSADGSRSPRAGCARDHHRRWPPIRIVNGVRATDPRSLNQAPGFPAPLMGLPFPHRSRRRRHRRGPRA